MTLCPNLSNCQIPPSGGGEEGIKCHAGQTPALRRGGRRGHESFKAHSRGPRGVTAARDRGGRGCLPPHRVGGPAGPREPAASAARRGQLGPSDRARGLEEPREQTVPPATDAARTSSQCLRAGFTAPPPPKSRGLWDRGVGSPGPPPAPEKPCPVLAIKSTSDEIKRAREGVDRRVGEEPTCR